jgi:demethylmenaquinone methyltransferase/2-methoxy-6-polyprenyl-1,4-benzoquinol methylase
MEAVFPGAAVVGLDASRRMLAEARRKRTRGRVLWVCGDAAHLPFRAGVFDGAAGHSVLYLTAEPEKVLWEVKRVLGPGGRAGFVEPRARVPGAEWRSGREGLRFLISMLGWRWVSRSHRRYEEVGLVGVFRACGFCEVIGDVAVEGFGVCGTGRKPSSTP